MHITKYNKDFSRRKFLETVSTGVLSAGVLTPLWPLIANAGDIDKAYPEELLNIGGYTKGKVDVGDYITADNVELVKELLDPMAYKQISEMGRKVKIVPTTTDITKMFPAQYLDATLKNAGKAMFDGDGNVVTKDGKRWIGGSPFPNPTTGAEALANLTLSWGRYDQSMFAIRDWDMASDGEVEYQYDLVWVEMGASGLLNHPSGPYLEGHDDMLRYQSVWFTHPNDSKGTSFLNAWKYDQRQFPELNGYLPAFKRVRRFPTNQRFEPLVPGMTVYLSDAWATGDPLLTWGNFKIVGRGPFLGACSNNWIGEKNNWLRPVHGGPKGESFFDVSMELCPDVLVVEAEPTGFPRAPVSKKRLYIDLRNTQYISALTFDRRGELWKSFEPHYAQYVNGSDVRKDNTGNPVWTWSSVHSHDIQTNRISRLAQVKEIQGGYKSAVNMGVDTYDKYLTVQAMRRLGR